jgi:hypothetical protein
LKYILAISYVKRKDLLYKAVNSVKALWPHTMVIDNSDERDLRNDSYIQSKVKVYEPPAPLTVPQKFNYLQELAEATGCDVYMHMHDDAEAPPGAAAAFLAEVEKLVSEKRRWGIAFTTYDILAAANMEAIRKVGEWDNTFIQYSSDNDYYWRIHLAGYEFIWTGIPVIHYGSSSTWSDPYRIAFFQAMMPIHLEYYKAKWGGYWYQEMNYEPFVPNTTGVTPAQPNYSGKK